MKKTTILLLAAALLAACNAPTVTIPDEAFRAFCLENFDANKDGKIQCSEIDTVTQINLSEGEIGSLQGIEHFSALAVLNCSQNQLTALDLSKNTALAELYCSWNTLAALDVSQNPQLTILNCNDNQLTALDISNNPKLEQLSCYMNQLNTLDVTDNTQLALLYCRNNQLTTLNLSANTLLVDLDCTNNPLTTIYVWQAFTDNEPAPDNWGKPEEAEYVLNSSTDEHGLSARMNTDF